MPGLSKLAAIVIVLTIAVWPPAPLHASTTAQEEPAPILAGQSVSIDYGNSLTFHVIVTATAPLTEAYLHSIRRAGAAIQRASPVAGRYGN